MKEFSVIKNTVEQGEIEESFLDDVFGLGETTEICIVLYQLL